MKTPDVLIDGVTWEMKAPTGGSKYTIQNQFKRAAKQSRNLILDSRRMSLKSEDIKQEVAKQFTVRRSIKKLKLVTKSGKLIDF